MNDERAKRAAAKVNCPACGSPLKEHKTAKSAVFLVCSKWPTCRISGTPELMQQLEPKPVQPRQDDPVPLRAFVTRFAQLKIYQCRLRAAKTAEEREVIRKQALEALNAH